MVYLVVSMLALYFDELSSNRAKVYSFYWAKIVWNLGSGGGSVTRAVASDSRGPRVKSIHWQKVILDIYCQLYWKDENKEKEAGNGPFKKMFEINIYHKRKC